MKICYTKDPFGSVYCKENERLKERITLKNDLYNAICCTVNDLKPQMITDNLKEIILNVYESIFMENYDSFLYFMKKADALSSEIKEQEWFNITWLMKEDTIRKIMENFYESNPIDLSLISPTIRFLLESGQPLPYKFATQKEAVDKSTIVHRRYRQIEEVLKNWMVIEKWLLENASTDNELKDWKIDIKAQKIAYFEGIGIGEKELQNYELGNLSIDEAYKQIFIENAKANRKPVIYDEKPHHLKNADEWEKFRNSPEFKNYLKGICTRTNVVEINEEKRKTGEKQYHRPIKENISNNTYYFKPDKWDKELKIPNLHR